MKEKSSIYLKNFTESDNYMMRPVNSKKICKISWKVLKLVPISIIKDINKNSEVKYRNSKIIRISFRLKKMSKIKDFSFKTWSCRLIYLKFKPSQLNTRGKSKNWLIDWSLHLDKVRKRLLSWHKRFSFWLNRLPRPKKNTTKASNTTKVCWRVKVKWKRKH